MTGGFPGGVGRDWIVTRAETNGASPSSDQSILFVVLAFAVLVLAVPAGRAPVWEPNNARWVLLARDMVEHHHWLMPEIRGVPNEGLYKPQLFAWAIALASLPAGHVTELTAGLPSLVSAIAGVAGAFAIGRRLWGVRAGMMAALILATTLNYFVFAQQPLADVMMTASMVWALHFLLRTRPDGALGSLLGFYSCVGIAMLCKGPPGLSALGAAAVAVWLEDGRSAWRRLRPLVGVLVLAVFALPWMVPYLVGARSAFVHQVLFGEYARWFLGPNGLLFRFAHMPSVLLYFLPWAFFLPPAVIWWRRNGPDHGRRYILWWTLTLWTLIGLSGSYRARYFLPVYPGLAILTGEFFARARAPVVRPYLRFGAIAFVILSMALLIAMVFPPTGLMGEGPVYMPDTIPERALIALLAAIGIVGVLLASRRDTPIGLGGVIAIVMGAILAIEGYTSPMRRARYYDVPALGAAATAHTTPDGTVFGYPDLSLEFDVYIHRRIVEIGSGELGRLLAEPSTDVVILTRRRWMAAQTGTVSASWHVIESRTVGGKDVVVIGGSDTAQNVLR
jgi:4-amino-4-deoxy-L-arabinose transferase-like glycosyltransferase